MKDPRLAHAGSAARFQGAPPGVVHTRIQHARGRPTRNAFEYAGFCLRIDLDHMDGLEAAGIRYNRPGVLSFHDRDHGPRDGSALQPWIRALLREHGIAADGQVALYTFPRMFGYVFNPVSFWVCHDIDGSVRAVLCEVCNTFGERHNYLLADAGGKALRTGQTLEARKCFHVSPFCEVSGRYLFRFSFVPGRWLARIDYYDDGACPDPLLRTRISGPVAPLDRAGARALPWRYGLFTLGVIARIHWQALRLWRKGVRYVPKPAPPVQATTR
jgi:DUF1365 family protein